MVSVTLILGKVTEKSMRNNQIGEIWGLLQLGFAPTEEEEAPLSHGWEVRDPSVWYGPNPRVLVSVTSMVPCG